MRAGLHIDRWLETEGVASEDLPADAFADLGTKGNKLSVFRLTSDITAERIATAIAAGRPTVDERGYAIIDSAELEAIDIEIVQTKGGSADEQVNEQHYNLTIGTVTKLTKFAGLIARNGVTPILQKQMEALLQQGLRTRQLDERRMNHTLVERLRKAREG